jgi:hypothetical protein
MLTKIQKLNLYTNTSPNITTNFLSTLFTKIIIIHIDVIHNYNSIIINQPIIQFLITNTDKNSVVIFLNLSAILCLRNHMFHYLKSK